MSLPSLFKSLPLLRGALARLALLGLAGLLLAPSRSLAAADFATLGAYDYSTSFAPLVELDAAIAEAGKDPVKESALTDRLNDILRQPSTTFASRQAICERLPRLLTSSTGAEPSSSHPTLAVLSPWLEDAKLSPLALLALETVPGSAVDQLLQSAAQRTQGAINNALLASLSRRHPSPITAPTAPTLSTLIDFLGGTDLPKRELALAQLSALPAADVSKAIAEKFLTWPVDAQYPAIVLLGRLGNAAAIPTVLEAVNHPNAEIRLAATHALGHLPGTTDSAKRLLDIAATRPIEESKAALAALALLNGPGVSELLIAGAREGATPVRVACLKALSSRNAQDALPLLFQLRNDPTTAIRSAALDVLGDIAPFSQQATLIDWTLQATESQELGRAQRALVTVTQRSSDAVAGVSSLLTALEKASPAVQQRNLRMLSRLGDDASLACAIRLSKNGSAEVSAAAIAALSRWPNAKAIAPLADVAGSATDEKLRNAAAGGVLEFLTQKRGLMPAEHAAGLPALFKAVQDPDLRKKFLVQLRRAADENSAKFAESFVNDPALAAEAKLAAECIRANLLWPPAFAASNDEKDLRRLTDKSLMSRWSVPSKEGEWLEIDFKVERPLHTIILNNKAAEWDFPERYEVTVIKDPKTPGLSLVKGEGALGETIIELPPGTRARTLRITLTAGKPTGGTWSICDFQVE